LDPKGDGCHPLLGGFWHASLKIHSFLPAIKGNRRPHRKIKGV